jgi:hypothetical protein
MEPARLAELQVQLAEAILKSRSELRGYMEEAIAMGKKREANSWKARIREIDKQIAQYGLDRYASRS